MVEDGFTPRATSIRNEIMIWSKIWHPNVLQFLGANILDEKPFIVMPYLANGDAREYLLQHPDHDRLQILHGISLGLHHLHSHKIVHGDLKARNVLINDNAKAVLCDFGLSRVKGDVTSRTKKLGEGDIMGSYNWMAPERLQGDSVKKPCDIYAFAMTLYEIFTNETPLGDLFSFAQIFELVVRQDVRPKRPNDEDSPQLSNKLWQLAEECWVKDPECRPTASAVCDTLSHLLNTNTITRPLATKSPSHAIILPQAELLPCPTSLNPPLTPPPNLTLQGHTSRVLCAAFSHNGKFTVFGSDDCTIMVWNTQTGNFVLGPLKGHTQGVGCVAFSPDGRRIASGSYDHTVRVWDSVTGQAVAGPFEGHTNAIWSVSFSFDGKLIASGSRDKTIRVWNAQTGDLVTRPAAGHTNWITSVTFSGDGKKLVSGSKDKTVRVWDVKSGRPIHNPLKGHQFRVRFVAFSPGGERIVSASRYGDVCVWDAHTGALVSGPSKQHENGNLAVVFTPNSTWYCAVSPDGKWIAARKDGDLNTVQVWDSKNGQLAISAEHTKVIFSVSFSPDSKHILSTSMDKTVRVHSLDF